MKTENIPSFGLLSGVRVVHLTQSIAGPYTATRMADFGADVIWVENPKGMDVMRPSRWNAEMERRNMRSLCLDTPSPEGQKIFYKLLETTDIVIDSFRGGQMAKWGITDDKMFEVNPKLVIVHVSGYGQTGIPEYVGKPSFDPIAQAYGCYMIQNGFPDREPVPAFPFVADYYTALQAAFTAVSALYHVRETGIGESIDVAQYETMMSVQGGNLGTYLNTGKLPMREGSHSAAFAGYGTFHCKDGNDIYCLIAGAGVLKNALKLFGLDFSEDIPRGSVVTVMGTKGGGIIEKCVKDYCAAHTALEVEQGFAAAGIPCTRIFDYTMAEADPHYQAREVFTEWENTKGEKIRGINVFPKLRNSPGRVWRGLMSMGEDTPDILEELGFSAEEIAAYQESGVASKRDYFYGG